VSAQAEKLHIEAGQERLVEDSTASEAEMKRIEKGFRNKEDMAELLLRDFLPSRIARITRLLQKTHEEAEALEAGEIATLKNTIEFAEMDAKMEAGMAKQLAEAEKRKESLEQYHAELTRTLSDSQAEMAEIEAALAAGDVDADQMLDEAKAGLAAETELTAQIKALEDRQLELHEEEGSLQQQAEADAAVQERLDEIAQARSELAATSSRILQREGVAMPAEDGAAEPPASGADRIAAKRVAGSSEMSGEQVSELQMQLKQSQRDVKRLEAAVAKASKNEELLAAHAELESVEKKLRRYKELLAAAEQESLLAQERLLKLMRENANMAQQIEDAQAAIRASQEELRQLRGQLSSLQADYEATLRELEEVKRERDELKDAARFKAMYEELCIKHDALEEHAAEQKREITRLEAELADARSKLAAALEELAAPMAEMLDTAVQAEESAEEVSAFLLNMMLDTAQQVGETSQHWKSKLVAEEEARRAAEQALADLEERCKHVLEEMEAAKAKINKLSFQLKEAQDENSKLSSQVATLTESLADVTQERDELLEKLRNLEAEMALVTSELAEEKSQRKAVVEKLSMLEMVHAGLEKKYKEAQDRIEELERQLAEAIEELRKHGVVGKWKEAALAAQLAAAKDKIKIMKDAGFQTDEEEKEVSPAMSILPEVKLSAYEGETVETTVRIANIGDSPLMLEKVEMDKEAPWVQTDWRDAVCIDQYINPADGEPNMHELKLRCMSRSAGVQKSRTVLTCNDPKQPHVTIPVEFTVMKRERPPSRPSSRDGTTQASRPSSREGGSQTDPMAEGSGNNNDDELERLRRLLAEMQAELDKLRAENADLKQALADKEAELAAIKAKLDELEAQIKAAGGSGDGDDDLFERMEWERKIRESLAHMVKETASRGVQTDTDEHKESAHAQREAMHTVVEKRNLHKPRFLAPLLDDEQLAQRPIKPLRWVIKLINSVYDAKFMADAVDNRYGHPHDPLPEFIYMWTCKRYGLRDLVGATRWDLANAVDEYSAELAEVRLFAGFMFEEYGTEQLGFFLYCRSVVQDHASNGLPTNSATEAGMAGLLRAVGRYLPLQLATDVIAQVLGNRLGGAAMEALLMQVQHEGQAFAPERVEWDTAPELDASAVASFYEKYGFRELPKRRTLLVSVSRSGR